MEDLRNERSERGGVTVVAAACLVVVGILALGLGRVGTAAITAAQASSAADAVALAGAAAGDAAAERAARRNDAVLVSASRIGDSFQVSVRVGSAVAVARAIRRWVPDCARPLDCHLME